MFKRPVSCHILCPLSPLELCVHACVRARVCVLGEWRTEYLSSKRAAHGLAPDSFSAFE